MPTFIVNIYERTWAFTKYEVIYIDTDGAVTRKERRVINWVKNPKEVAYRRAQKMVEEWQLSANAAHAFVTYIVDKKPVAVA
ncbi:hypothetical protein FHY73_15670 [Bacillus tropicus]|uniref:hypothetical protein n=1 Tax=Bacillus tropicus TaxID=2026188 RepID=UPI0011219840|nr:hypothetical protein [Bacillus tropicus]TNP19119.1 hypothetical protein FHY73_15670 [Bacillus tropicus]